MADRVTIELAGQDSGGSAVLLAAKAKVDQLAMSLQNGLAAAAANASQATAQIADKIAGSLGRVEAAISVQTRNLTNEFAILRENLTQTDSSAEHLGTHGGLSVGLLKHAARDASAGMLMLAGETRGTAGEISRLLAFGISGFAHGGGFGLGLAAITGLIHLMGSASEEETARLERDAAKRERFLAHEEAAYQRLIDKVHHLDLEERARKEGRPVAQLEDEEDVGKQLRAQIDAENNALSEFNKIDGRLRELDKAWNVLTDKKRLRDPAFVGSDEFNEAAKVAPNLSEIQALEKKEAELRKVIETSRTRRRELEEAQNKLDEHARKAADDLEAKDKKLRRKEEESEGKRLALEVAGDVKQRMEEARKAHEERMRQIEEERDALVAKVKDRAASGIQSREDLLAEAEDRKELLATEVKLRMEKAQSESDERKMAQSMQDEIDLLGAVNEEERKRVALRIRLRQLQEEGATADQIAKANAAAEATEATKEAEAAQKKADSEAKHARAKEERDARGGSGGTGKRRRGFQGDFSSWSPEAEDPQAYRARHGGMDAPGHEGGPGGSASIGHAIGEAVAGTIKNLFERKTLQNADGSWSTTSSMSFREKGLEVLIPTVIDGVRLSVKEAIEHYRQTGEHLGKFTSASAADAYATRLHNEQEKRGPGGAAPDGPGGKKGSDPWDSVKAGQDAIVAELKAAKESLAKGAKLVADGLVAVRAAVLDDGKVTVAILLDSAKRLKALEDSVREITKEKESTKILSGSGAGG